MELPNNVYDDIVFCPASGKFSVLIEPGRTRGGSIEFDTLEQAIEGKRTIRKGIENE